MTSLKWIQIRPDFDFWLNKLNQFDGNFINAEMVRLLLLPENIANDSESNEEAI